MTDETTALKTLPSELNTIVSSGSPRPRRRACVALAAVAMVVAAVAVASIRATQNSKRLAPAQLAVDGGPNGDDDYHPCLGEPRPCHEPTAATSSASVSALASSRVPAPATKPAAAPSPVALPNKKPTYTGYTGGAGDAGDAGGTNLAPTIDDDDPVAISMHDDAFHSVSELDAAGSDGGPNGDDDYHPCLGKPRPCHEPTVSASVTVSASAPAPAPIQAQ